MRDCCATAASLPSLASSCQLAHAVDDSLDEVEPEFRNLCLYGVAQFIPICNDGDASDARYCSRPQIQGHCVLAPRLADLRQFVAQQPGREVVSARAGGRSRASAGTSLFLHFSNETEAGRRPLPQMA